jgi:hypothetical protein
LKLSPFDELQISVKFIGLPAPFHQCKLGFVNVLDGAGKLDMKIGEEVLRLI